MPQIWRLPICTPRWRGASEQQASNGAFTYYALKALKTLKPEATYIDWHKAIIKYLPSANYPQSPQIVGSDAARNGQVFA